MEHAKKEGKRSLSQRSYLAMLLLCLAMLALNGLARVSTPFADWYVRSVYPHFSNLWSRLSGLVGSSIGERLILLWIAMVVIGIPLFLFLMLFVQGKRKLIANVYGQLYGWSLCFLFVTETLHCFIMYQCTTVAEEYYPNASAEYANSEILAVYEEMVTAVNALAPLVERDEDNHFLLSCDVQEEARTAMQAIGEQYPQLSGYYPCVKPIASSYFMTQQSLLGIYFPFTIEANYNPDVYDVNLPSTLCHELSHLKGVILEDEAGFFAFLACIQSDNIDMQYAGYINALEYMINAIDETLAKEISAQIDSLVWVDLYSFVPEEYWEENEEKEIISTETVKKVTSTAMDTSLQLQGVEDGKQSYRRIVSLICKYYLADEGMIAQSQ